MPDIKQISTDEASGPRSPSLVQLGTGRQEFGGIPSVKEQKNWSYSMIHGKDDSRVLRLDNGNGRVFSFRFDSGLSPEDVAASKPVAVTRLGDVLARDKDGDDRVVSKGSIQVHKSGPSLIHATFHDGKGGTTLMFEENGGKWSMKPGRKSTLAEMTAKFVRNISKQAVDSAEFFNGMKPGGEIKSPANPQSGPASPQPQPQRSSNNSWKSLNNPMRNPIHGFIAANGIGDYPSSTNFQRVGGPRPGMHLRSPFNTTTPAPIKAQPKFISTTPLKSTTICYYYHPNTRNRRYRKRYPSSHTKRM
jgi:hypothetical protein